MKKVLTIAIPTYNRELQLVNTLRSVLAQKVPSCVQVLIIDNCSKVPVNEILNNAFGLIPISFNIIRNKTNIGLAANILRCFELAEGEWMWLLGDDDPPYEDAISVVIDSIQSASESDILIKYNSTNGGQVYSEETICGLKELCRRFINTGFYSNFLFISTSVFRVSSVMPYLATGYHFAYSVAPHVALVIRAIIPGGTIRLIPREIVLHGVADLSDQWSSVRVSNGFTALVDIEGAEVFQMQGMKHISSVYLKPNWMRRMIKDFMSENGRSVKFWRTYYLRFSSVRGGFSGWSMAQSAWLMGIIAGHLHGRQIFARFLKTKCGLEKLDRS